MVITYCGENGVAQLINAMKKKTKSVGHDGLSTEMLKHCCLGIEKYLSEAFFMSISERKFPKFRDTSEGCSYFQKRR